MRCANSGARRIVDDEVRACTPITDETACAVGQSGAPFANRTLREIQETDLTLQHRSGIGSACASRRSRLREKRRGCCPGRNASFRRPRHRPTWAHGRAGPAQDCREYIQATSRVGREAPKPGLVVTLLNIRKPRDRNRYEQFRAFHMSFYRAVEATSVTPFARPARWIGLLPLRSSPHCATSIQT